MTKADGTHVTVKLDESFTVTSIESGRGECGPDGQRRTGGSDGQDRTGGPADDTAQTAPTASGTAV